jgi:hypothetical protein
MAGKLSVADDATWFAAASAGAPAALRDRAAFFLERASGEDLTQRLASAGQSALANATSAAPDRATALDLLAADSLITLALLATSQQSPGDLGTVAASLRARATIA